MISEKMESAINAQINKEMYSSYLYLSMSAYLASMNLKGFANWMSVQVQEETAHAMALFNYLIQRGGKVELEAIEKPPSDFSSILDLFEATAAHEVYITSLINKLYDIAEEEHDRQTQSFLKWFVDEQVEEEANAEDLVLKLKLINSEPAALIALDKEMSTRVFVPPIIK